MLELSGSCTYWHLASGWWDRHFSKGCCELLLRGSGHRPGVLLTLTMDVGYCPRAALVCMLCWYTGKNSSPQQRLEAVQFFYESHESKGKSREWKRNCIHHLKKDQSKLCPCEAHPWSSCTSNWLNIVSEENRSGYYGPKVQKWLDSLK